VRQRTLELTDPRALRAVAHPVRLSLVGLLRREGALTATEAGHLLGESAANCSFHLRQLAKHGLVEEAGGGRGRERPWRATASLTSWPNVADDPDLAAALGALNAVVVDRYFEQVRGWLAARDDDPPEWQEASTFGDRILYVTPAELAEVKREVEENLARYEERAARPELRPEGTRAVTWIQFAFPAPPADGADTSG
jgi:DNA-binding transcriptional ArsR family regulator